MLNVIEIGKTSVNCTKYTKNAEKHHYKKYPFNIKFFVLNKSVIWYNLVIR